MKKIHLKDAFRELAWSLMELFFFGSSLFFLIPPLASDDSPPTQFLMPALLAIIFFSISRLMALIKRKKPIAQVVMEILFFCFFAWILYLRFKVE